ncbi:Hypothetical predicted protein, partial [Paramuricea clavata]
LVESPIRKCDKAIRASIKPEERLAGNENAPNDPINTAGDGEAVSRLDIEKLVPETVAKTLPVALSSVLAAGGLKSLGLITPTRSIEPAATDQVQTQPGPSRGNRFYTTESKVELSDDLRELTTQAFSKSLPKETWQGLLENYPLLEGTESILHAPTMEAAGGVLAYRTINHSSTYCSGSPSEAEEGPDPDLVKGMLEDALVLLGNANVRLNSWQQRRFSEYLTEVGKRTLIEEIPSDQHLFPDRFMTVSKMSLINKPHDKALSSARFIPSPQPFRGRSGATSRGNGNRKLRWNYTPEITIREPQNDCNPELSQQQAKAGYPFPRLTNIQLHTFPTTGSLIHCLENWKIITQDPWILQTVQGYKIPLIRSPHQWRLRETNPPLRQQHLMDNAVQELLNKAAIKLVQPVPDQFVSTLFLVEKENNSGQYRPVINLRALNQFVEPQPFKMESLQVVKALVQPGDYLMKMDLEDTYYTVPIHQDHCRYLRVIFYYRGNLYEFRCLPFGLSSAPRAFTKILKPSGL